MHNDLQLILLFIARLRKIEANLPLIATDSGKIAKSLQDFLLTGKEPQYEDLPLDIALGIKSLLSSDDKAVLKEISTLHPGTEARYDALMKLAKIDASNTDLQKNIGTRGQYNRIAKELGITLPADTPHYDNFPQLYIAAVNYKQMKDGEKIRDLHLMITRNSEWEDIFKKLIPLVENHDQEIHICALVGYIALRAEQFTLAELCLSHASINDGTGANTRFAYMDLLRQAQIHNGKTREALDTTKSLYDLCRTQGWQEDIELQNARMAYLHLGVGEDLLALQLSRTAARKCATQLDWTNWKREEIFHTYKEISRQCGYGAGMREGERLSEGPRMNFQSNAKIQTIQEKSAQESQIKDRPHVLEEALGELKGLISLEDIAQKTEDLIHHYRFEQARENSVSNKTFFILLEGSTGTGKSTWAALWAKIIYGLGRGSDSQLHTLRGDEISKSSTESLRKYVQSVNQGTILIRDFEDIDVDTAKAKLGTVLATANKCGTSIVLSGGSGSNLLERCSLLAQFPHRFKFPDWTPESTFELFNHMLEKEGMSLEKDAVDVAKAACADLIAEGSFEGGWSVKNLLENSLVKHAAYANEDGVFSEHEMTHMGVAAFGKTVERNVESIHRVDEKELSAVFEDLDKLIGMNEIKQQFRDFAALARQHVARQAAGLPTEAMTYHSIYEGPPGTGKTTIARLTGRMFHALGVLPTYKLKETTRKDFIADYSGQTPGLTNRTIDSALGGVLYIDEAYTLADKQQGGYGAEAIGELVKRLEDDRHGMVVVMSGYTREMGEFIASNTGLASRFPHRMLFESYSAKELTQIFGLFAKKSNYELSPGVEQKLETIFQDMIDAKDPNFGNARTARNLFERALLSQARRLNGTIEGANTILPEDIEVSKVNVLS